MLPLLIVVGVRHANLTVKVNKSAPFTYVKPKDLTQRALLSHRTIFVQVQMHNFCTVKRHGYIVTTRMRLTKSLLAGTLRRRLQQIVALREVNCLENTVQNTSRAII